ncbi:MAG: PIN domain-containing protein [Methylacidiphilales bacterium]|nr:PIN domain-containing protein [Candidatus Methylacidiphilales bacterium]
MIDIPTPCRAYVDTNAFIEMFERHDTAAAGHLVTFFVEVSPERLVRYTSEFTLAELWVRPAKMRDEELIDRYDGFVRSGPLIEVIPVDRGVLYSAALTRAEHPGTKLPDAIHIATALRQGCDVFVTGDKEIRLAESVKKPFVVVDPFQPDFANFVVQFTT